LIAQLAGLVTRWEGKKFLKLKHDFNLEQIFSSVKDKKGLPLYIHIPFCRKLCPFCCFNRYLFKEDLARNYFLYLKKELDIYLERGFSFSSFYIGGGTPTVLMDELMNFINYIYQKCSVNEISLETTPSELTDDNIRRLKEAGIKRLSAGVQSFNDEYLKAMGRTLCTSEEIKNRLMRTQGQFTTLNIDLIFNFPFQNLVNFRKDIETFKALGIDQVTFYPLMPSPHKKDALEKKFNKVDFSREKQFYDVILDEVFRRGYIASTVWCFSTRNQMIDEYIVDSADYAAIGSGSVSLMNGNFLVNTFSLGNYAKMLSSGSFPVILSRTLTKKEYMRYYFLTKLFGLKVNKKTFSQQFGSQFHDLLRAELATLKIAGIIRETNNEITVTPGGMFTVSVMMREFFASLNTLREVCIEKQM
jgi:coproporphyrinogen III oxidase-like Fe-S oxidoreductase